ncbi:Major facilitator-type transporter ecdD [Fusarium oxysporum f. sp. albedinis]|nr:Major facilitator-type transporter ecdD [Fusarium oxysporum f. sp. albedinis]
MSSPPEDSHPPGTVSRRLPLSALVSECDHALDINMFRAKWENDSNDRKRRWRRTQVYMVPRSFAKAKEVMSDRAINELCEYLKRGTWNSTARNASGHPCYKHFKGTSPCPSPFAGPYYPYFFIIQALFPLGEAVKGMYRDLSDLWEMDLDPTRPFYPRLADSEREFSLIMGQKPSPQVPGPGPVTMSSADQPQSPKVKAEQDSGEDNHTLKRKAQPEMLSNNNSPDNDREQLTSVRSDIKQETSEFQTQLHKDTTGTQEIRRHSIKAQKHANAAFKLANTLVEDLGRTTEHSDGAISEEERPSKRVREN